MRTFRLLLASALAATGLAVIVSSPASAAASVGTFDQCERAAATSSCTGWTGGNLISGYTENMVVPQRVEIAVTGPGNYTFSTEYADLSGSKHIIDYLATYNLSVPNANACQDYAASICAGTPSTFNIPSDPAARGPVVAGYNNVVASHELPQSDRQWTMWGGSITGSSLSHTSGTGVATVNFTTTTPGASTVILVFGAHLALTGPSSNPRAWAEGASTVNGNAQLAANLGGAKTHNIKVGSSTPPPPPAAFSIAKSVTPTTGAAGAPVTYKVTVTNTGGVAGSTTFNDNYNDNLTSVSTPAGCTAGTGAMSCTTGSIVPGGQQVFTYTANLPATFSGGAGTDGCAANTYPVRNTATLANNTSATALVCATAAAQFTIAKTATPANPSPGQTVTYNVTVTNAGNAAGSTTFADDYDNSINPTTPAGCTKTAGVLNCTTGSIAPNGGTQVFTYTADMPASFNGGATCPGGYQVSNTATINGGPAATKDVCVQAAPSFTVTKGVSDTIAAPGQVVTYTLAVKNTGTASGSTTVTDTPAAGIVVGTLPAGCATNPNGSFTCTTGTILAGATQNIVYTATMPSTFDGMEAGDGCAPNTYPITNTAVTGTSSSTKTVCVGAAADFEIKKVADPATAVPGQSVTYTVTVKNIGQASGSTTFVDNYDNSLSPTLPISTTTGSCTQGAGQFDCTTGKLLAGATVTFTYTATMPLTFGDVSGGQGCAPGTYPVSNTAKLASNPSAVAVVCVTAAPAYTITKAVDKPSALPGDVVTYTVTVKNTGAAAGSTSFSDDFDSRLDLSAPVLAPTGGSCSEVPSTLSCTTRVIPSGGQQTFTYSATLPATYSGATGGGTCAPGKYQVGNTATLGATTVSADVCVTAAPSFLIDKSVSNESPAPGDTLTYSITVTNNGNAAGSASFTDDYDNRLTPSVPNGCTNAAGTLTCTTGELAAGASRTFTYTAVLPTTYTGPGGGGSCAPGTYAFENTADLDGGPADSVTACVNASPAFSITKEASDTTVAAGDSVTYKVTVSNTGAASGSTTFVDDYDNRLTPTVPAGCTDAAGKLSCTTGDIASGDNEVFTYTATMPATFGSNAAVGGCAAGSYRVGNTATLANDSAAGVEVCVAAAAAFTVTKTADDRHVLPGDVVTYTVTVKNGGTAAGSTTFTDTPDGRLSPSTAVSVPGGNDCAPTGPVGARVFTNCATGVIEPGGQQTFTYTAAVPTAFTGASGGTGCASTEYRINNKVVVGSSTDEVNVCVTAAPAFTIDKSVDDATVAPGADVAYTIVVTNTGDAAGSTSFTDDYDATATVASPPAGCTADVPNTAFSCTTGTIDAGASQTFTYTGKVPPSFVGAPDASACNPPAFPIVNKATLANGTSDKVTVCVNAGPNFSITKKADDKTVDVGDAVRYTVTVTNTGTATGATTFTDTPDGKYDLSGVSVAGCTLAAGTYTCSTGNLNAGQAKDFVFDLTAPETFTGTPGTGTCAADRYLLANSATLDGNTVSDDVCVLAAPAFEVTKKADDTTVAAGDPVTYTVTVKNTGTASGSSSFVDDYDDRLLPGAVDISGAGGSCAVVAGTLECSTGTINAGAGQSFTYTATMPATFTGNSGGESCEPGRYPVVNSVNGYPDAAVVVCVAAAPEFTVEKSASTTSTTPGQDVTYTIVVTNTGNATGSTTAVDDFDPRLGVRNPSAGCTLSTTASTLTCATGPLDAGQSRTFQYVGGLPDAFDGPTGGSGCPDDQYRVPNTVTIDNGESSTVEVCVDADAAYSIAKSVDDESGEPGQTVEYTVTVTNTGNAAGGTSFEDDYNNRLSPTVPNGCADNGGSFTCTTEVLPAGGSQDFVYTAKLPATYPVVSGTNGCDTGSYGIQNTATIEDDGPSDSATVCVAAAPDLSITKTVDDDTAVPGQTVTYQVVVKNSGPAAAPATTFIDDYTDTLTDVTTPDGCTAGSGQLSCTTGVIESGDSQTFTYSATIPVAFTGDSGTSDCPTGTFPIANAVSVDGGPSDDVKLCVPAAPDFTVTKSVDTAVVDPGATVTYQVVVKNVGDASGSTTFTDDYDDRLDPTVPADCTKADGKLECTSGTLNAGDQRTFTYTAVVPATFTGTSGGGDCEPGSFQVANSVTSSGGSTDSQDVCVTAAPRYTVSKTVDKPQAQPGDTVHYKVTVTNAGAAAGSTTIVDDYDNRLSPTVPDGCSAADGQLTCETGELLAGASRTFEYDATLPTVYSGESGVAPCLQGQYSVVNKVTIGDDEKASNTVCVAAAPDFTVAKSADDTTAVPGQTVTYTVTVANTGAVAGRTTFVDDYDNRLDPSVPAGCEKADGKLTCTTEVIEPKTEQKITYTAVLPATYTGAPALGGCPAGNYPVANSVVLDNGANAAVTVCVAAAPSLSLTKSATLDTTGNGDQTITYTLTYRNTGSAEALGGVVTDPIPVGTGFVSCTRGCTTTGGVATWNVGGIAPAGGTGTVVLAVKVTSNQTCVISNTAQVRADGVAPVSSNTVNTNVTPQPDTANAKASGSAVGLSLRTSGLLDLVGPIVGSLFTNNNTMTLSRASSAQNGLGGPNVQSDSLLSAKLPGNGSLVKAGVLTATSASSVTAAPAEARNTTTSEVAGICVVPVANLCTVESGTLRAVATTMANGGYAAVSTAGSSIENLRVAGVLVPVNLNQTTTIPLNKAIFGANSYVAINERTSSAGLQGQKYVADQSVAMIHVKITGVLLGVQAVELYIGQATSHSEFPKTFLCAGAKNQSVSGHAYTARLFTGPLLADLVQGYAQISPLGGEETEHIAAVTIPQYGVIANAKAGDSSSAGSFSPTASTSRSWAEVAGDGTKQLCVLSYVKDCVVRATAVRSEARSTANAAGSTSTDTGTALVDLAVFGIPIAGTPAPNTVLALPGIGFIVLNEQFCDNGATANHSCTAAGHTGLTVRAVRVVVTVANNLLGLTPGIELILSEAHADTTFG